MKQTSKHFVLHKTLFVILALTLILCMGVNVVQGVAGPDVDGNDGKKTITLTKMIRVDEIYYSHGVPTFIFKLSGTTRAGTEYTYYQSMVFDEAYVKANAVNGYVSQSVTFSGLHSAYYFAEELDTSRYYLAGITDVVNGVATNPSYAVVRLVEPPSSSITVLNPTTPGVTFDLSNNTEGSAVFLNLKYEYQDYSDAQTEINVFSAS